MGKTQPAKAAAIVRPYKPGDLGACRALWVELTQKHRELYDDPDLGGTDPGRRFDDHLGAVGPEIRWVAEVDQRVVGLAGLMPRGEEAELEPLVVAQGRHGQGIGRLLVGAVREGARRAHHRFLVVRPDALNVTALQCFHGLGFDNLGQADLLLDLHLGTDRAWRAQETIAGRRFRA